MVKDKFRFMGILFPTMDHVETPETKQIRVIPAAFYSAVIAYVVLIIGAEVVATTISPVTGAIIDGIVLVLLANLAYFIKTPELRNTIPALALVPVMRILSLAIPISKISPIYWYILVGVPLLISALIIVRIHGLPSLKVKLSPVQWILQILFGLTGITIGILAAMVLPTPKVIIPHYSIDWIIAGAVILVIFNGFTEEIIFRGLVQDAFTDIFGGAGILLTSLMYASLYMGAVSPITILFFGLTGLLFAIWTRISHSLWGVILAHCLISIIFLLLIL